MLRYKEFLDGKVWAAVYSRAFVNWLLLRSRLSSGAPPLPSSNDNSEIPTSLIYAAISIKTHGRTLVKFILGHSSDKTASRDSDDKENQTPEVNIRPKVLTEKDISSELNRAFIFFYRTSDFSNVFFVIASEMVNLWLGSRLLLYGAFEVAELYTLLGNAKEARIYQLELLRIAQRFHIPSLYVNSISFNHSMRPKLIFLSFHKEHSPQFV